jgi:wyosine [tRNA(Phe)-imidazoG37] synthetase (radical SAM superfamily)
MQKNSLLPGIIYGPVFSRRLGRSLGINLLPSNRKTCSFDCVYCECRKTEELTLTPDRKDLPAVEAILFTVEQALRKPRTIDHLTFSGNGEPTLHPDFPEIVQGIREIRDRLRPQTKLVLFTNASTAGNPKIAEALRWIDVPIFKLDAGDQSTFSAINQPLESISLNDIVVGLRPISPLIIQSMLINGDFNNVRGEAYESWANLLVDLKPKQVQIYTAERPTAYDTVGALEPKMIQKIEDDLRERFKLNVKAY